MEWSIVKISKPNGRNIPYVSIGRGQMSFNTAACNLINDNGNYKYAQLLTGVEKGKTLVAVKFLDNQEQDVIQIKRRTHRGKMIQGMVIANKTIIGDLFGKNGKNNGTVRYNVELISDNMLKIID